MNFIPSYSPSLSPALYSPSVNPVQNQTEAAELLTEAIEDVVRRIKHGSITTDEVEQKISVFLAKHLQFSLNEEPRDRPEAILDSLIQYAYSLDHHSSTLFDVLRMIDTLEVLQYPPHPLKSDMEEKDPELLIYSFLTEAINFNQPGANMTTDAALLEKRNHVFLRKLRKLFYSICSWPDVFALLDSIFTNQSPLKEKINFDLSTFKMQCFNKMLSIQALTYAQPFLLSLVAFHPDITSARIGIVVKAADFSTLLDYIFKEVFSARFSHPLSRVAITLTHPLIHKIQRALSFLSNPKVLPEECRKKLESVRDLFAKNIKDIDRSKKPEQYLMLLLCKQAIDTQLPNKQDKALREAAIKLVKEFQKPNLKGSVIAKTFKDFLYSDSELDTGLLFQRVIQTLSDTNLQRVVFAQFLIYIYANNLSKQFIQLVEINKSYLHNLDWENILEQAFNKENKAFLCNWLNDALKCYQRFFIQSARTNLHAWNPSEINLAKIRLCEMEALLTGNFIEATNLGKSWDFRNILICYNTVNLFLELQPPHFNLLNHATVNKIYHRISRFIRSIIIPSFPEPEFPSLWVVHSSEVLSALFYTKPSFTVLTVLLPIISRSKNALTVLSLVSALEGAAINKNNELEMNQVPFSAYALEFQGAPSFNRNIPTHKANHPKLIQEMVLVHARLKDSTAFVSEMVIDFLKQEPLENASQVEELFFLIDTLLFHKVISNEDATNYFRLIIDLLIQKDCLELLREFFELDQLYHRKMKSTFQHSRKDINDTAYLCFVTAIEEFIPSKEGVSREHQTLLQELFLRYLVHAMQDTYRMVHPEAQMLAEFSFMKKLLFHDPLTLLKRTNLLERLPLTEYAKPLFMNCLFFYVEAQYFDGKKRESFFSFVRYLYLFVRQHKPINERISFGLIQKVAGMVANNVMKMFIPPPRIANQDLIKIEEELSFNRTSSPSALLLAQLAENLANYYCHTAEKYNSDWIELKTFLTSTNISKTLNTLSLSSAEIKITKELIKKTIADIEQLPKKTPVSIPKEMPAAKPEPAIISRLEFPISKPASHLPTRRMDPSQTMTESSPPTEQEMLKQEIKKVKSMKVDEQQSALEIIIDKAILLKESRLAHRARKSMQEEDSVWSKQMRKKINSALPSAAPATVERRQNFGRERSSSMYGLPSYSEASSSSAPARRPALERRLSVSAVPSEYRNMSYAGMEKQLKAWGFVKSQREAHGDHIFWEYPIEATLLNEIKQHEQDFDNILSVPHHETLALGTARELVLKAKSILEAVGAKEKAKHEKQGK